VSRTLSQPARLALEVKKSRFIALAEHCSSEPSAKAFLNRVSVPDATHNCWAWKSGQQYRFDDDGEVGGTAGRPILAAIENQGMDQVAVVVVRHYGGIKLGTGRLARAYGGAAAECLRTAAAHPLIEMVSFSVALPFDLVAVAHQIIDRHDASKAAENYSSSGVEFRIKCPRSQLAVVQQDFNDVSAGQAVIKLD